MKTEERRRAREMRKEQGRSIKEIARILSVSTSSVSLWVRDIELTDEQHDTLRKRNALYDRQVSGRAVLARRHRTARLAAQVEGRQLAHRAEPLHIAGCMLYWAEGSRSRNQVRFTNSDPEMVRFFCKFLRRYFDVTDDDLRVTCHLYADHMDRQVEIEDFWLRALGLPRSSLCRSVVNVYSKHSKRKRLNALPFGTCRIVVTKTSVVQSIYGAIQEYGGFERPEWLD